MDENLCKIVIENKDRFIPLIFTAKQIGILERYLNGEILTAAEKATLYSTIKKKLDALTVLNEEFYVCGAGMIEERAKEAREILRKIRKEKAFISGSFLYNKKYNDVDIYVISRRRKQYHKGKNHFICITEEDLKKPLFLSALKFSVSNFHPGPIKTEIKRPSFNDLLMAYQTAIIEILDNEDQKDLRELIFEYHMQIERTVLDSFSLYKKTRDMIRMKKPDKIERVNKMTKELLMKMYSRKYLYNELVVFLRTLEDGMKEFKANDNIIIYREMLGRVKDECRRAEIKA